jgi:3-isopropylmalate/(R)-2-methylmalate dehydratase small subunit
LKNAKDNFMALEKIKSIKGKGVYVFGDDIDTDRIIPARFMKCVTFEGLGQYIFYDVRFNEKGNSKDHILDKPENKNANILISGANFGCGSSREHAPQALFHWGIRGIIAESFAEIFFGNCTTLGIPCITLKKSDLQTIEKLWPHHNIEINLENKKVIATNQEFKFEIPENARLSLLNGNWDSLGELLEGKQEIDDITQKLPYLLLS